MKIEIYSLHLKLHYNVEPFLFDRVCLVPPEHEAYLRHLFDPALILPNKIWYEPLYKAVRGQYLSFEKKGVGVAAELAKRKDWLIVAPVSFKHGYVHNSKLLRNYLVDPLLRNRIGTPRLFYGVQLIRRGAIEHVCDACPGAITFLMKKSCDIKDCRTHLLSKYTRRPNWLPRDAEAEAEQRTPPFPIPEIEF